MEVALMYTSQLRTRIIRSNRPKIIWPSPAIGTFNLAPLQGALRENRYPGLKPWAKGYSPFGAQTS